MEYEFYRAEYVVTTLKVWLHTFPKSQKVFIWQMTGIALIWSLWRLRNRIVFQWGSFDEDGWFEMCMCWFGLLGEGRVGRVGSIVVDLIYCPGNIKVLRKSERSGSHWVWKPPDTGFLKVNVGRSFLGNSGKGSIGGAIRDSEGKVLI